MSLQCDWHHRRPERGEVVSLLWLAGLSIFQVYRWQSQSSTDHEAHRRRVAFRAALEAVNSGALPRKALHGLSYSSIEDFAEQASRNLKGTSFTFHSTGKYAITH